MKFCGASFGSQRAPARRWLGPALMGLIALALRLGLLWMSPPIVDRLRYQVEMRNIAISLATRGTFADPYGYPTGETAHLAPIGPFLASLAYRCFGISRAAELTRGVMCSVISSLVCGLTVLLAVKLGLNRRAGILAGILAATGFTANQLRCDMTELDACLGTLFFCLALLVLFQALKHEYRLQFGLGFGVLAALAVLSYQSMFSALLALLLCAVVLGWRRQRRPSLRFALCAAVLMVGCTLPWSLRNYYVFHQWVWIRSDGGLSLRLAQYPDPEQAIALLHPANSATTRALIRSRGEPAVFQQFGREALDFIRNHPGLFARRTLRGIFCFWIPPAAIGRRVFTLLIVVLAFAGLALLWRERRESAILVASIWVTYPLVYYVVPSLSRYQQPIGFTLYLLAAYTVVQGKEAKRRLAAAPGSPELRDPAETSDGVPQSRYRHPSSTNVVNPKER